MKDVVRIKLHVSTGFAGGTYEDVIKEDMKWWKSLSPSEQEIYLEQAAVEFRDDYISCNAWVMEEGEDD